MRLTIRVLAWFAAAPFAIAALLVLTGAPHWSSVAYALSFAAVLYGLVTLPLAPGEERGRRRHVGKVGAAAVVLVAAVRACTVGDGAALRVGSPERGARVTARLVDEADLANAATRGLVGMGALRDDARELPAAMRDAYAEMRADVGAAPSPVLPTYLGAQGGDTFDLVTLDPVRASDRAVIFLHGFGGGFDLPCWQIARASRALTACPSTRWTGDWLSADGRAALDKTLDVVRARGARCVVLAGLSAGGYSASRLASRKEGSFAGVVLISGADPLAPAPNVPTLVIHGRSDTMAPFDNGRDYAALHASRTLFLDAGHFAMLVRRPQVDAEIRAFVDEACPDRRAAAR